MFRDESNEMRITVSKIELLNKLRLNKGLHMQVVKEAREGYIEKAKLTLSSKLDELKSGKCANLTFNLIIPVEHTAEYDTAIQMLEWANDMSIELTTTQFRNFVQDKWDWSAHFLHSNAMYSKLAADTMGSVDYVDGEPAY